jgi:acetyl-CoA acetyltransferase
MPVGLSSAAIAGVGCSAFLRHSDTSTTQLAFAAIDAALDDCGLQRDAIDGILSYSLNDSIPVTTMARQLGLPALRWHQDIHGGGSQCASILWDAAMAIEHGLADCILVYRALRGHSGKRMGQIGLGASDGLESQFLTPYGMRGPVNTFALTAQRWLFERGHSEKDLATIVCSQRQHALGNPQALFQSALSEADYFQAPVIATPLRRLDCCLETDGACALIICSSERAKSLGLPVVAIRAAVRGGGAGGTYWDKACSLSRHFSAFIGEALYRQAGITSDHIDYAYLYDAYSFLVAAQLEDFGFCAPGSAINFIRAGETGRKGTLPVNSNGGMLSEGYVHGLNNIVEAVRQLRGNQGERQLPGNGEFALCSGFGGRYGSAAILQRLH